jgi:hypothetical protein
MRGDSPEPLSWAPHRGALNSSLLAADPSGVSQLVLGQGLRDTRTALVRWNGKPGPIVRAWLGWSVGVASALLAAVYVIAVFSPPDPMPLAVPGVTHAATLSDVGYVLFRNGLVLALHALACVAGFIAGSSLPIAAATRRGVSRWVHEKAGPLAILFVGGATAFSLGTQAIVLGVGTASLSAQLGIAPGVLLLALLPHALPELAALFLPLAAWLIASRRGEWRELLAATLVTVAIAVPVLVLSAVVETYVSPYLLRALVGVGTHT